MKYTDEDIETILDELLDARNRITELEKRIESEETLKAEIFANIEVYKKQVEQAYANAIIELSKKDIGLNNSKTSISNTPYVPKGKPYAPKGKVTKKLLVTKKVII